MELTILKEKEMPLLERKRVTLTLATDGKTPSRVEVIKAATKKLNTKETNIVVRHVYSQFGTSIAKAILHVYKTEEGKKCFERKYMVDKNIIPDPTKPAAAEEE